jgi:hypothetical protein
VHLLNNSHQTPLSASHPLFSVAPLQVKQDRHKEFLKRLRLEYRGLSAGRAQNLSFLQEKQTETPGSTATGRLLARLTNHGTTPSIAQLTESIASCRSFEELKTPLAVLREMRFHGLARSETIASALLDRIALIHDQDVARSGEEAAAQSLVHVLIEATMGSQQCAEHGHQSQLAPLSARLLRTLRERVDEKANATSATVIDTALDILAQ